MINIPTLQLVVIAIILVALGFGISHWTDTDNNFIQDRQKAYERYRDSLNKINEGLKLEISAYEIQNAQLRLQNDSIQAKINILDSSLNQLRRKYHEDVAIIDDISIDSNIVILSKFLSKEAGN